MTGSPADGIRTMDSLARSYTGEITEVKPEARSIVARIGTGDLDRYQTVIDPAGMDLTAFRENPVVLWEHGKDPTRGRLPIGRNKWVKTRARGHGELLAETIFVDDDYSRNLYEMYRDGVLRGWSIHVLPDAKRSSPPTREELRLRPELSRCQMMYRGSELTEYSGTAVPGNARTLTMLEERGIWFPAEARTVPPAPRPGGTRDDAAAEPGEDGGKDDEIPEDLRRYITGKDGKWVVHAEDGKVLGEHATKAEAVKQLQAIEAHKHAHDRALAPIDVGAIHRHYLGLIEDHYRRSIDAVQARLDLMRGRV